MAKICRLKSGLWLIRFKVRGRPRWIRAKRLGDRETRESLELKFSHLEEAADNAAEPAGDVLAWLERLDVSVRRRLAKTGLLAGALARAATSGGSAVSKSKYVSLTEFTAAYVASRTDAKKSTRRHLSDVARALTEYFEHAEPGKLLRDVTPADADDWRRWLRAPLPKSAKRKRTRPQPGEWIYADGQGRGVADNTARRWCGRARQFFKRAIDDRIISENPFKGQKVTVQPNRSRFFYVTAEMTAKVFNSCRRLPNGEPRRDGVQWALVFALTRIAGLRCPSELVPLKWGDVEFAAGVIRVRSPKTEHHANHEERELPIFPELRPFLRAAYDEALEAANFPKRDRETAVMNGRPVVTICRDGTANLRSQLCRIIRDAGLSPWPKLFQNLRSTRETELVDAGVPEHKVVRWLGNSQLVARKFYLQETYEGIAAACQVPTGALQKALQKGVSGADGCDPTQTECEESFRPTDAFPEENADLQPDAGCSLPDAVLCGLAEYAKVPPVGLEPTT